MKFERRVDWLQRLWEYINDCREKEFKYGEYDCCLFAANAVEVMTGENPAKFYTYSSEEEAETLMEKNGGVGGLATKQFGKSGVRFRRGDVVMADLGEGNTLGICTGISVTFAAKPRGIVHIPRRSLEVKRAWMIG